MLYVYKYPDYAVCLQKRTTSSDEKQNFHKIFQENDVEDFETIIKTKNMIESPECSLKTISVVSEF